MRSPRYFLNPPTLSFFLYAIHYAQGIGEAPVKFFPFFDPYRAGFWYQGVHNN